jgi:hypothetical protein
MNSNFPKIILSKQETQYLNGLDKIVEEYLKALCIIESTRIKNAFFDGMIIEIKYKRGDLDFLEYPNLRSKDR